MTTSLIWATVWAALGAGFRFMSPGKPGAGIHPSVLAAAAIVLSSGRIVEFIPAMTQFAVSELICSAAVLSLARRNSLSWTP